MYRPHTLKYTKKVVEVPYQDDNGNWISATTGTTNVELPCRVEPNGGGRTITTADGVVYQYEFTVYLDLTIQDIPIGQAIDLYNELVKIGSGTVRRLFRTKHHVQLWV